MIKIDARKIEYQFNVKMFVWNCNNLIENTKTSYEVKFSTIQVNPSNLWSGS